MAERVSTGKIETAPDIAAPVLEITPNLLGELELATLDIAMELGGKQFVNDLRKRQETEVLWGPATVERLDNARSARIKKHDLPTEKPMAELIVTRAAEIQQGRKPAKRLGKKALRASLSFGDTDREEPQNFEYPESLSAIADWPQSHAAFQLLLQYEADRTAVSDYMRNTVLGPFQEDNKEMLGVLEAQIEDPYYERSAEAALAFRKQVAEAIHAELLSAATVEEKTKEPALAVTDDTCAPIAILLTAIAATHTDVRYPATILEDTAKVANDISDLQHSKYGLVFSKIYGIGEIRDFKLVFPDAPAAESNHLKPRLEMNVAVTADDNHPRELQVQAGRKKPHIIWDSGDEVTRDLISISCGGISNGEVRAIKTQSLSTELEWASSWSLLDASLMTLTAIYADKPEDMPVLEPRDQRMLQTKFKESVLDPLVTGVHQMTMRAMRNPYAHLESFIKATNATTFAVKDTQPNEIDIVRRAALVIAETFEPKDEALVRTGLQLRGIDEDRLCKMITEEALPNFILDNDSELTQAYLASLSIITNAMLGTNISEEQLGRHLQEVDIAAARRDKLPRRSRQGW